MMSDANTPTNPTAPTPAAWRFPTSAALAAALALAAACGATAPVNYSQGTRWTMPMVGPLEQAEVVVAATVHDKGPFLFVLAPDAQASLIDRGVAEQIGLYTHGHNWRQFLGPNDALVSRRPYEVLRLQAGDLTIRNVVMWSTPAGSLTFRGQPVHGILGSDLLTRTIVLDIDRDRGVVTLVLTGHEQRPEDATVIAGRVHDPSATDSQTLFRKLVVPVRLQGAAAAGQERGGASVELAVDLAARRSQVFPKFLDHVRALALGGVRVEGVTLAPISDRRAREVDFEGILGQDVLARYRVVFDPDDRQLVLAPREPDLVRYAGDRLRRWGEAFSRCTQAGCVDVTLAAVQNSGQLMLRVARAAGAPAESFEVVLQGVDAAGNALRAPLVRVTLNPEAVAMAALDTSNPELAAFTGAVSFRVIDASLYVPACPREACVATLQ